MKSEERRDTLQSLFRDEVLRLADPYLAVRHHLTWDGKHNVLMVGRKRYPLEDIRQIYLVGAGKAGVPMSRAVVDLLGQDSRLWQKFGGGAVSVYREQAREEVRDVQLYPADHPNPNQASLDAAQHVLGLLGHAGAGDLVLAVISGGGSCLLTLPFEEMGLPEFCQANQALVTAGASIQEMNIVRKHVCKVKGGKLRLAAPEADFATLVLSDVIGDDLSSIASGPTVPDPSTFQDAIGVLEKYELWDRTPVAMQQYLQRGAAGTEQETLKHRIWQSGLAQRTYNLVVASNATVLRSLADLLRGPAYAGLGQPIVDEAPMTGDVDAELERHSRQAQELWHRALDDGQARLLLCGGEGIVRVPPEASGQGGRNQHYALMAARRLADTPWCVLAAGTDGVDGNSPAAGAVVDGTTIQTATSSGLSAEEYVARYDSYGFFRQLEERTGQTYLVATGPTGTNVNDIVAWWLDPGGAV